jgi:hypothetical protein
MRRSSVGFGVFALGLPGGEAAPEEVHAATADEPAAVAVDRGLELPGPQAGAGARGSDLVSPPRMAWHALERATGRVDDTEPGRGRHGAEKRRPAAALSRRPGMCRGPAARAGPCAAPRHP